MAHLGSGVEYGLHCLLFLVGASPRPASSRDLADLQGVSPSFLAKIFPKLEKAGIVAATEGLRGGYRLARPADEITVLDVVNAIEGGKPLFDCRQIRGRCAVFGGSLPAWSTDGVCAVHAIMLRAEAAMRGELAATTLGMLAATVTAKTPPAVSADIQAWLGARAVGRREPRAVSPGEPPG